MAARSKYFFLISGLTALLFLPVVGAAETESMSNPVQLATLDFAHATQKLDEKTQLCKSKERDIELSAVKALHYPPEEVKNALGYFYMREYLSCIQPELGRFYTALEAIRALDPGTESRDVSRLFSYEQARYYEYKATYQRFSSEHREKLESLEELQQPFNLLSAVRSLSD